MSDLPKSVKIKEVGPREGFQFEKGAITVKELWYRPSDANCCPSGVSLTRWWLRDGTLKADPAVQVS